MEVDSIPGQLQNVQRAPSRRQGKDDPELEVGRLLSAPDETISLRMRQVIVLHGAPWAPLTWSPDPWRRCDELHVHSKPERDGKVGQLCTYCCIADVDVATKLLVFPA